MENIIEPTMEYDFNKLKLSVPITQPASTYLTRIFVDNKPLYIQTPKCETRNGFIKSGKKIYCDLMFSNRDSIFISWIENLENKCRELIYEKGEMWFQTKMEKEDIEVAFTSPLKIYKSGSFYLMRVYVKPNIKIFNETNDSVIIEEIKPETNLISILEVQGIKFTSRNFQIELELKQTMIVSPDPFLDSCLIKSAGATMPVVKEQTTTRESISNIEQSRIDEIVKNILSAGTKPNLEEPTKKIETTESLVKLEEPTGIEIDLTNDSELFDDELTEVNLDADLNLETITLKKPNHVYQELYNDLIAKAKKSRVESKMAYLEAKELMEKYMLEPMSDDSFSDSDEDYEESDGENYDDSENEENEKYSGTNNEE